MKKTVYRELELIERKLPRHRPLTRYIPAPVLVQSFQRTTHPAAQWYAEAGLGLFIHWGISSVHGSVDLSWGMMADTPWQTANKITPAEYFALAQRFRLERFDPDRWLRAASRAGFRYAVLTVRHEDGYTLWPSDHGEFGTRTHMDGVDLVGPFVEACRKNGLKIGFYYSPDGWYENRDVMSFSYRRSEPASGRQLDVNHEVGASPEKPVGWRDQITEVAHGHIRELLTRYGPIDLLWFSGGPEVISIEELRNLQPGIVLNSRMHGYGDFETPEGVMPYDRPARDIWWERSDMWDPPGWGYHSEAKYRSTAWILSLLAEVRSWNGNLLISWAPGPDGAMPEAYYKRLGELEGWMEHNEESIFGCGAGPYPENCTAPATTRAGSIYLHITSPDVLPASLTDIPRPTSVRILRTGENLGHTYTDRTLVVDPPVKSPKDLNDVIQIVL
jgi:alpha-L-fucosidase